MDSNQGGSSDNLEPGSTITSTDKDAIISHRARWASIAIREDIAAIQKGIKCLVSFLQSSKSTLIRWIAIYISCHKLVPTCRGTLFKDNKFDGPPKVCIIGAGCAGLFTALIFDHLKRTCGLDVDYEILESNGEERVGGRLCSYYFENVQERGVHDYFDVGAMGFPDIPIMKR